jgi:mRNA interferase YafQ
MRELVLTAKFRRAYKKFVSRDRRLQRAIDSALVAMSEDLYMPSLDTHKLPHTNAEVILLLDLGTHDDVY